MNQKIDMQLFISSMAVNRSYINCSLSYLQTRVEDIATALELNTHHKYIWIGSILGAAVYYGMNSSSLKGPSKHSIPFALIHPDQKSVIEITTSQFEYYAVPFLLNRLGVIKQYVNGNRSEYHYPNCFRDLIKNDILQAAWKWDFPNYCKSCKGVGFHSYPDTREEPGGIDTCECNLIEDIDSKPSCPRCGVYWPVTVKEENGFSWLECQITEGGLPCPSCKWNWNKGKTDSLPEWLGCDCYVQN